MSVLLVVNEVSDNPVAEPYISGKDPRMVHSHTGAQGLKIVDPITQRAQLLRGSSYTGGEQKYRLFRPMDAQSMRTFWIHAKLSVVAEVRETNIRLYSASGDKFLLINIYHSRSFGMSIVAQGTYRSSGNVLKDTPAYTKNRFIPSSDYGKLLDLDISINTETRAITVYINKEVKALFNVTPSWLLNPNLYNFSIDLLTLETKGSSSNIISLSELIVTDNEPTFGWRLAELHPESIGSKNEWVGGMGEVGYVDLLTSKPIYTDKVAQQSYNYSDVDDSLKEVLKIPQEIRGVYLATAVNGSTVAPVPSMQPLIGKGDGNVQGIGAISNVLSKGVPVDVFMEHSPFTGSTWTFDEVNALEMGMQTVDCAFITGVGKDRIDDNLSGVSWGSAYNYGYRKDYRYNKLVGQLLKGEWEDADGNKSELEALGVVDWREQDRFPQWQGLRLEFYGKNRIKYKGANRVRIVSGTLSTVLEWYDSGKAKYPDKRYNKYISGNTPEEWLLHLSAHVDGGASFNVEVVS